jgi:hypothetical protein
MLPRSRPENKAVLTGWIRPTWPATGCALSAVAACKAKVRGGSSSEPPSATCRFRARAFTAAGAALLRPRRSVRLTGLLTEHTAPELLYLETKWASLVSYGMTIDLLKDVLPIAAMANAATVRNHLHKVAERREAELGEERPCFIEGCPADWEELPIPEGPIIVGIDGGYVRSWEDRKINFEVIVGKSVPENREHRYFGLVQTEAAAL